MRSCLLVAGNRPDRFDKAMRSASDIVVLDLEDAVPEEMRASPCGAIGDWITPQCRSFIRIDAMGSPWFEDDVALAASTRVVGAMVPKVDDVEAFRGLASAMPGLALLPIVETALGISRAGVVRGKSR